MLKQKKENKSHIRNEMLEGKKGSLSSEVWQQTDEYIFAYTDWCDKFMHACLPNWNNILLIQSFIMRGWRQCQTLYKQSEPFLNGKKFSPHPILTIWEKCFPKHLLAHALKCFSSTGEKAAKLLAAFIHLGTGLTEGSFLHHGVWKRWNITASEV